MNNYIQNKLKDYLKELQENNFKINSGRKLELITAYKNNSLLYEDVPEYIKDNYDLPSRDEGIDVVKLNNEEIIETYQCKDYNGRVSNHKLGTYFGFHLYQLKNIPFNIVGSINTVFNSAIKPIIYDVDEDFGEYIDDNKEECVLNNLRWYQHECIEKIEKLYSELNVNSNEEFRVKIPCGCGKTAIMYYFGVSNYNILILVPKINIATQIKNYFENILNKVVNTYWTNTNINNNSNITICVYDSVDKVKFNKYDMIFVDEAHHIIGSKLYKYYNEIIEMNESYIDIIKNLECTLKIYLSATINVKHIENSYELDFNRAIKEGYLTDYEFNILYVEPNFEENYHKLIKIIKENKEYKHIIIYCNRIETAEYINKLLNKYKIISHIIVSKSENSTELKREKILEDFRNGLVKVLCSVNCLNEGTDLPITDTCMFVNDRGSEINIIQYIGRILRKHKYKSKSRIVLFDTNQDDGELKYENYMRVMDKIDFDFKQDLKHKLKIYNYSHDYKFDLKIKEKENEYFNKIIHFRLSWEDKLKLCQEFHDIHYRMPKRGEKINDFKIGNFITILRRNYDYNKIKQLENIFKCEIPEIKHKEIKDIPTELKFLKCEEYAKNNNYNYPKSNEITNDDFHIGQFIKTIKRYQNPEYIKRIEEIFRKPLVIKSNGQKINYQLQLKYCNVYYHKYYKLPKQIEKMENGFNIGGFIGHIKEKKQINKMIDLENIFHRSLNPLLIKTHADLMLLIVANSYFKEFYKLPEQRNYYYNNFCLKPIIRIVKKKYNQHLLPDVIKIFHIKDINNFDKLKYIDDIRFELIEEYYKNGNKINTRTSYKNIELGGFRNSIYNKRHRFWKEYLPIIENLDEKYNNMYIPNITDDERLELCKKWYSIYKTIPKRNDIIDDWKIGKYIKLIKLKKQHPIRPKLEEIFHCKFD